MLGLFDTHILMDYLKGMPEAQVEFASYSKPFISAVSVVELQLAAREDQVVALQQFLSMFEIVPMDEEVAMHAVAIKRHYRQMKLPHAVIWASARLKGALLVTRNAKVFPATEADIRIPY